MTSTHSVPSVWQEGFVPRKSRGQNFLVNQGVLERMTREAGLTAQDLVVEVGTGSGNLTRFLVQTGARVIGYETDRLLYQHVVARLSGEGAFQIRHQDFLSVDLDRLIQEFPGLRFSMVSNLPYVITSPVLFKVLTSSIPWRVLIFMVQKEFADRLLAPPGVRQSGPLSLAAGLLARGNRIMQVSRHSFRPVPRVDSTVIRLVPRPDRPETAVYHRVLKLAGIAFRQRRKKLITSLQQGPWSRQSLLDALAALDISETVRPENITTEQWLQLSERLENIGEPQVT